jgi:pectate disaccharide-lyase
MRYLKHKDSTMNNRTLFGMRKWVLAWLLSATLLTAILMDFGSRRHNIAEASPPPDPPPVYYTLTILPPVGNGTFSHLPTGTSFLAGTVLTFTATPATGYHLDKWTDDLYNGGGGRSDTNPETLTMDSHKTVGAEFVINVVSKIQYEKSEGQWVDMPDPLKVYEGSTVNFKAIPSHPTGWPSGNPVWGGTSGASGTGETTSVTFNTISTSSTDYKTVTAQSGTTLLKSVNVLVTNIDITAFTAGLAPYDATPLITSFITSTETTCDIDATASEAGDWTVVVPSGWSGASSQSNSTTYDATATVPTHPDGGRAAGWQIKLDVELATGVGMTVTATQSATDRIRQMYVDHNIKVPARADFNGGTEINLYQTAYDLTLAAYRTWCDDEEATLEPASGYRNPEHNQDIAGASHQSMHQYGKAIDISPMSHHGGVPGKQDDTQNLFDTREDYGWNGHCYIGTTLNPFNKLHFSTEYY